MNKPEDVEREGTISGPLRSPSPHLPISPSPLLSCYLGLGSNLGDRAANLGAAIGHVSALGVTVTRVSSVYETEPVSYRDQPWFLNQAAEITISQDSLYHRNARRLLDALLAIEDDMGRERLVKDGPRVIDIDLLLFGDAVINQPPWLIVPHPRLHLRRFVLEPLCEIAPDVVHPALGKTARQLLTELHDPARVRVF